MTEPAKKDPPALTAEELEAAKSFGMTPEEYGRFKDPHPVLEPAKEATT